MSEFVEIKTSVADIISVANGLRAKGDALRTTVTGINADIAAQEEAAETFPPDKFTGEFRKTYDEPVQDSKGTTVPTHLAIRNSAVDAADKLVQIGETVGKAMINYSVTDDDSGTDIAATPRP
jgi:hypothetical protein